MWSRCERCVLFLPRLCVCCHSIVGLGLCLCDRVVSLWNSGDGLCWVEGCVVFIVNCQLFMCCGVCFSGLWVAEWRWVRGVWSCCLFSSSLCFPLSFCCWCSG